MCIHGRPRYCIYIYYILPGGYDDKRINGVILLRARDNWYYIYACCELTLAVVDHDVWFEVTQDRGSPEMGYPKTGRRNTSCLRTLQSQAAIVAQYILLLTNRCAYVTRTSEERSAFAMRKSRRNLISVGGGTPMIMTVMCSVTSLAFAVHGPQVIPGRLPLMHRIWYHC